MYLIHAATVLATAKLTSFSFLLKNADAYFRERKRIFQRTKTHISENENAKKKKTQKKPKTQKKRKRKKTKTHKNEDAKEHISIGALYKTLQIINSSFKYKKYLDYPTMFRPTKKKTKTHFFQERRRIFSRTKKQKNENEDANSRRTMSS